MKDREHYIKKAKTERGLTDKEIDFFLGQNPRADLLPYFATLLKHGLEPAEAAEAVSRTFPE